jgi:hypothetical protein
MYMWFRQMLLRQRGSDPRAFISIYARPPKIFGSLHKNRTIGVIMVDGTNLP